MSEPERRSTLAAILDSTSWDYAPGKDGRLLLAPLERLFASVSWEFKPQHLAIAPKGSRRVVIRDRNEAGVAGAAPPQVTNGQGRESD